jgi:DNA-binding NtrC family response regulator
MYVLSKRASSYDNLNTSDQPDRTACYPERRGIERATLQTTPVVSVVDDDHAIRVALGSLIRLLGLQVRAYASAEAFLASGDAETTSCLICDIRMSGMSGVEMHERQRKQNKAPPTIFASAYPTHLLLATNVANGALALLEKPWRSEVMVYWIPLRWAYRSKVAYWISHEARPDESAKGIFRTSPRAPAVKLRTLMGDRPCRRDLRGSSGYLRGS